MRFRPVSKRPLITALAALVLLAGCENTPGQPGSHEFIVHTVDGSGAPVTASLVHWFVRGSPEVHAGHCLDASCSAWGWSRQPIGDIVIAALWFEERGTPGCYWRGYGARPLVRTGNESAEVQLQVVATTVCPPGGAAPSDR